MLTELPPRLVACACLLKGSKKASIELPNKWNYQLEVAMEDIEYIATVIEEIYKISKSKTFSYPEPDPDEPNVFIEKIKYPFFPEHKKSSKKDDEATDSKKDEKKKNKDGSKNRKRNKRSESRERRKRRRYPSSSRSASRSRERRRRE